MDVTRIQINAPEFLFFLVGLVINGQGIKPVHNQHNPF